MRTKNSSTMAAEIVRSHQSTIFSSPPPGSSNTDLADSPKRISRKNMILPPDYSPGTWDVICQRGKDCNDHIGNQRFQFCVENHMDRYVAAQTRQDKSAVITAIVNTIRGNAVGRAAGRFVTKDIQSGRWHNNDNKVARDKVGNALRDTSKQIRSSPPRTRYEVIIDNGSPPVTPNPTLHGSTTQNMSMLGDSRTYGNSERLYRENNHNLQFPPPLPFAGYQLPRHRQPRMVHTFETSPLEERKQILPNEAFYNAHHHQEQAYNAQTHRQRMVVHSIETSPLLEDRNRMYSTEAFNYAHQHTFNSQTSSVIKLEEEDSLYGNVSTTGGGQVHAISNRYALQQQQQQAREYEELPWEEQMALALEPTPLR